MWERGWVVTIAQAGGVVPLVRLLRVGSSAAAQQQFIRTADEFVQNPRSGTKIGREFGINPQLATTTTGTLLNTPGGGEDAAFQSAYGVQSLMHALRQWENVNRRRRGYRLVRLAQ